MYSHNNTGMGLKDRKVTETIYTRWETEYHKLLNIPTWLGG